MLVIVTGVSGSGKTTLGSSLADKLNVPFFDADDFHTEENVAKMSRGIPLNDEDRMPWLKNLANLLLDSEKSGGAVLACSALKEHYRKILQVNGELKWIHLQGARDLIWERMLARQNHYMKAEMLDSQFATWEEPDYGLKLSIAQDPMSMLEEAFAYVDLKILDK